MKIIIDIPEYMYDWFDTGFPDDDDFEKLWKIIKNGIPLPKGHGGLMILSKDKLKENQMDLNFSCQKWISEVGLSYATIAIIEAESEEE